MIDDATSASLQPGQERSDEGPLAQAPAEQTPLERGTFPLQARAELRNAFAYLQARERADYYQAIVRVFLKHARRYYRIYLTLDDLAAELIPLYSDYSVEKCRADLDQLAAWGNVVQTFDTTQRHTTIESFRHPTVLFRATPETLEIEETFLRLEARTETTGELRQGDLAHLVELFGEVDALVREALAHDAQAQDVQAHDGEGHDPRRGQALAETWRRLADQARTILDNTSKYIHTLAVARQEASSAELHGYVRYKQQVVEYVQSFAIALELASVQLQRVFREWEETGARDRILVALAENTLAPSLALPPLDERLRDAASQMNAVADWFRGPEWAEYFGKAARFEVNSVLERAQLLAATSHLGASYLLDLEALARHLLGLAGVEAASQALAIAFGHALPRVISEHLSAAHADVADHWEGAAPVHLRLEPIQRGSSLISHETTPVRDRSAADAYRLAELARRHDRLERVERLFGLGERALVEIELLDDVDATLLVEITRYCLGDASRRWRAEDGSTVTLVNPEERALGLLRSPRGGYVLPRYRFRRAVRAGVRREVANVRA